MDYDSQIALPELKIKNIALILCFSISKPESIHHVNVITHV